MLIIDDLNQKLFVFYCGYVSHVFISMLETQPLPMHSFPATDPLPVTSIALIAVDDVGGALRLAVRHQSRQDRGRLGMYMFALAGIIHREAFLDEARIVLTAHETVGVHHGLVERNVRPHTNDAICLQCPAHAQDRLGTRLPPYD